VARPFFVYMLRCADRSYYVGHTDNLDQRVEQHASGAGAHYTSTRLPVQLVWFEEFPSRDEAKAAEAQVKNWNRRKKEALIEGRIDELRAAARKDWKLYRQRNEESLATVPLEPTRDGRSFGTQPKTAATRDGRK
jgi:tRNA/rRNA methyltransferase